jgi:hypothetical protein
VIELIYGMPMSDYLAIEAASSGACKDLASMSPYAWRNRAQTSTPAQLLGTLAHMAILEPERFGESVVQPSVDLRTNAGKEALVDWLTAIVGEPTVRPPAKSATGTILDLYLAELRPRLDSVGIIVVTEDQRDLCLGMRDAVLSRSHTRTVIEAEGRIEVTGLCTDPDYEIPCKVRPDKLLLGEPIIISLKTAQSVAERDYLRASWKYGYAGSAWFYARMLHEITGEKHKYWELAVESDQPHDCALYEYSDTEIAQGEDMMRRGMETYRTCTESGLWPGQGWDWEAMDYGITTIGRKAEY